MTYSYEEIKNDILNLSVEEIYTKYLIRSENWYFENILKISGVQVHNCWDDFKLIVSEQLGIPHTDITWVGSAKTGYSFSPDNPLRLFQDDSDIDVVIISNQLFEKYWWLYRECYNKIDKDSKWVYRKHVYYETYRGFINEENLMRIEGCRKCWNEVARHAKKKLQEKMFIKHAINFRIYRSWEDFKEYNFSSINKLKGVI